jgi:hypothetical protein
MCLSILILLGFTTIGDNIEIDGVAMHHLFFLEGDL